MVIWIICRYAKDYRNKEVDFGKGKIDVLRSSREGYLPRDLTASSNVSLGMAALLRVLSLLL